MSTESNIEFKITFRNFQSSPSLTEHIKKKFTSVFKSFFDRNVFVHVILSKKNLCFGEVSARFPNFTLVVSTEEKDFYTLVNRLKSIIREQLRRHKEKLHEKQ